MDILTVKKGIICQQVNAMGVMGAGLALTIRQKWPIVYREYRELHLRLGEILLVEVEPGLYVANLCAQEGFGRTGQYTDYNALEVCLRALAGEAKRLALPVYIPYKMGCGLAGGDWDGVVCPMIERILPEAFICLL